ncbi:Magnesium-dependent phosphatase 1 [Picochlorum sp. SENEW3]|nr:Magnesium-dependent phosphatase 1 [Picochlorum sp. SENEW3]
MQEHIPLLIAFDLDGTLWYPEVDTLSDAHTLRPVDGVCERTGMTRCMGVLDEYGSCLRLMGDSEEILSELMDGEMWDNTLVAYVSRTTEIESAHLCLRHVTVASSGTTMEDIGHHSEIFPGCKVHHFRNLSQATGIAFEDMLFFDNERRNTADVSKGLGVTSVYTPYGMTRSAWEIGLRAFAEAKQGGGRGHVLDQRDC